VARPLEIVGSWADITQRKLAESFQTLYQASFKIHEPLGLKKWFDGFLRTARAEYHTEMGKLILEHEGTLERFTGDGIMIFLNDPVVVPNPTERAVRMAVAMRDRVNGMSIGWRKHGYDLSLGIGIAQGYATIGAIGFEGRVDYGAVGTVTNLAARLCGEAQGGQILTNQKTLSEVEHLVDAEPIGELHLKGFAKPISAYSVAAIRH